MINWRMKLVLFTALLCGRVEGRTNRVADDMITIRSTLQMFKIHAGRYPTKEEGLMALVERPATYPAEKRWQKIMDKLPLDPWNRPYYYVVSTELKDSPANPSLAPDGLGLYSLGADGISNSKGNDADDWNSWSEDSWEKKTRRDLQWDGPAIRYAGFAVLALILCSALIRRCQSGARIEEDPRG
jgi:general secretion pathway protein G